MKKISILLMLLLLPLYSQAFCGFYVARADSILFNQASQVVLVRDQDRTVLTMSSDVNSDVKDFAMVIPVPTLLKKEQIHVTDNAIVEHLDHYSAPRLVEYFDEDPCQVKRYETWSKMPMAVQDSAHEGFRRGVKSLGVTIEAKYKVGEYDIMLLSAKQSDGLITWLKQNHYRIPNGAEQVIGSYLKQGMYFFVAKVNLEEQTKLGYAKLRPIQVAYESPKFMLPIRLGMVNANGLQELYVYALTRRGRVESTNYRTVKLPSGTELPEFVKQKFADFYRDMFRRQVEKENNRAVFLEYAWDMNWCDPCAADPLSNKELKELGVFWVAETRAPDPRPIRRMPLPQAKDVFVSRLHLRYDQEHFPEDLFFQQTSNRENFQGRYVIRHPWQGEAQCSEAKHYLQEILPDRQRQEAGDLANLTGWDINDIRQKIPGIEIVKEEPKNPWWEKLWQD